MNNQEIIEDTEIRKQLGDSITLGNQLSRLRKNPDFRAVFEEVFVKKGLTILWENVRHLEEMELVGKGNEQNVKMVGLIKGQIKTRLDYSGFIDTVENDSINAVEALADMDAESEEE